MLMMSEEDFSDVHLLPPLKAGENDPRQAKRSKQTRQARFSIHLTHVPYLMNFDLLTNRHERR